MDGGLFIGEGVGYVVGNLFAKFLTKNAKVRRSRRGTVKIICILIRIAD